MWMKLTWLPGSSPLCIIILWAVWNNHGSSRVWYFLLPWVKYPVNWLEIFGISQSFQRLKLFKILLKRILMLNRYNNIKFFRLQSGLGQSNYFWLLMMKSQLIPCTTCNKNKTELHVGKRLIFWTLLHDRFSEWTK